MPGPASPTVCPWFCSSRTRTRRPSGYASRTSPVRTRPSTRLPVTTVPWPRTVNTRSTGSRHASCDRSSPPAETSRAMSSLSAPTPSPVTAETHATGAPSRKVPRTWSATSSRATSSHSPSTRSHLVSTTIPRRTPRSPRMSRCSCVWGMKPSSAATTSRTRSIPVAPASMFLMSLSCPGTSTTPATEPSGSSRAAKPMSMVIPRSRSSLSLSVSVPVRARVSQVFPWSTWPAVPMTACLMGASRTPRGRTRTAPRRSRPRRPRAPCAR